MAEPNMHQLEREVEAARAKLASDLSTLRSPATFQEFTQELKGEAIEAKDVLMEKASTTAKSMLTDALETIKAKAAENPAAVLAIGAGIAWRMVRRPPIATALVGAGLLSLLRTPAEARADLYGHAQQRFKEQLGDLAEAAQERAEQAAGVMTEHATAVSDAAVEKVQQWTEGATTVVTDLKDRAAAAVSEATATGNEALQATLEMTGDAAAERRERVSRNTREVASQMHTTLRDQETRDTMLLGAAGLAVAAAVSIAFQRRSQTPD